jgi:hypothetical protein
MTVDGSRVELSTDALVTQKVFQKECVSQINRYPLTLTERAWQTRMQTLLENITVVESSPDTTLKGEFENLLFSFCCDRARGSDKEEIFQGIAVWLDGRIFFQIRDLMKHLTVNNFLSYTANKAGLRLRDMGGDKTFWNVNGKGVHVWHFSQDQFGKGVSEKRIALPPKPEKKEAY